MTPMISAATGLCAALVLASTASAGAGSPPNILFIVYDDVGLDQMAIPPFGWAPNGPAAAQMPVLQEIAAKGISFTNFWSMPECSPSRAAFFTGRWPHRTGVVTAIIDPMLPACQLNPVEFTIPQMLAGADYTTAMIGKYHMAGGTSPGGAAAPVTFGKLDWYDGNLELPPSIDATVGAQLPSTMGAPCGAPTTEMRGAVCFPDGTCLEGLSPFEGLAAGGIPLLVVAPDGSYTLAATCADASCAAVSFANDNAYYAWQRTIVDGAGNAVQIEPYRQYMTIDITDRTVEWVAEQKGPWACIVTYTASHTPIQTPPPALLPNGSDIDWDCSEGEGLRQTFKLMTEAMDREQGRLLVELGLGSWTPEGDFVLTDPALTNTLIVVIGDNGSYGPTVRPPFNPAQAKGTVFQTGVLVPLVVAGPMQVDPGRTVDAMVNIVDLFGLFADVAGVDLDAVVPPARPIDSQPMLPYITSASAPEVREWDFAIYGPGIAVPGSFLPCLLPGNVCDDQTFPDQSFCEANDGIWYGGQGSSCCDLIEAGLIPASSSLPPELQYAVREGRYKLLVLTYESCAPTSCEMQFHLLPEPQPPLISGVEECSTRLCIGTLDPQQQRIFERMRQRMIDVIQSQPTCLGDGNKDLKIDGADLAGVLAYWNAGPSFYDFNYDGQTDEKDLAIVLNAWTPDCSDRLPTLPSCLLDPPLGNIPGQSCMPCGT
ncbi:MAG TPA: sulfatase-like hydrolase/transferase [Phycisphaerales bacterium]|nr:sulfatase-like hydrolase/transferase [Phycisphaerales bacterium]HMP36595.1 sulfatase-like hydrolase/transferase [Phycisphaerales bacterium]